MGLESNFLYSSVETEEEREHRRQTKPLFAIHTQRKAAVDISFVLVSPRSVITFLPFSEKKKKLQKKKWLERKLNFLAT